MFLQTFNVHYSRMFAAFSFFCLTHEQLQTHHRRREEDLNTTLIHRFYPTCPSHRCKSELKGKLHCFGNVAYSSKIQMQDKNIDSLLCVFGRSLIPAPCEQVYTFNGGDRETPLPPSEASKTLPKIYNTLHLHVETTW